MTNQLELPQQESKAETVLALLAISVALVAVSFAPILIRWSETEISPNATIFNRLWIATVVLVLWNGVLAVYHKLVRKESNQSQTDTQESLELLLTLGIFFGLSQVFWAWSLTQTNVANSTIFHNLTPLFTIAGGWLLFDQQFDRKFLIGATIAMGGAIALGISDLQIDPDKLQGDIVSLISAGLYGAYVLVVAKLRSKFTATTILLWCSGSGTVFILPALLFTNDQILPYSWRGWLVIIGLAVICQVLGQGLIAYSLNKLSSGLVALFQLLYPVLTAIFAWIIFLERLSFYTLLEFAVVLLGIYLAKSSQYAIK
ncbi:MAG: DMT family transporter [Prochloron sp. SP5CPC1]|nr:DMT family transporter [Candidatus Paraprochloron terpiosi SP5CPC1]